MKKTDYSKAVSFLKKCYPNNNIPDDTFKLWYDTAFINIDFDLFLFRLADCVEECVYIPMPSYFFDNDTYVFWINNKNAMSERLVKRLANIKKVVSNV